MTITSLSVRNAFDQFGWEFTDFWTRGNTFDAALRCYMAAAAKWGPNDTNVAAIRAIIDKMIVANTSYYQKTKPGNWADDFGWWGLAALTASGYLSSQDDKATAATYLGIAEDCWQHMYDQGYDKDGSNRPVPYGCANAGGSNSGTRNTITNVNLLLLSIRLYQAVKGTNNPKINDYLGMCYRQYVWFATWFTNDYDGFHYLTIPPTPSQLVYGRLVQERPRAKPSYWTDTNPTWQPGWTWSADQGMLIACLIGLKPMAGALANWAQANKQPFPVAFQSDLSAWIESVATALKMLLFSAPDHVLREAPFNSSFVDDPKDYFCGRGVLLRYLAEVRSDLSGFDFSNGIATTAAAVLNTATGSVFAQNWTPEQSDLNFNQSFISLWGFGDADSRWDFGVQPSSVEKGVMQATGLDVLGAAIQMT